jgi:superfamily II DNA or RNA helicase
MTNYLPIQGHYHAHCLTGHASAEDAFTRSLTSARVEMNPHQVDAALFALKSPFSRGVMLADEVGLGKTIEAGLVMSQRWAEQRRRILLIVPASLRKQWQSELFEKFGLKSAILEARTYNEMRKFGHPRPFERPGQIAISSYEFAARKAAELRATKWDLVVFDEAHRLRNVYRKGTAKTAKALREATAHAFKILLTATPLQNSLMELYGIVSMIDDSHFGGEHAFRAQYVGASATPASQQILRERLASICHRTLRRQVQEAGLINFRKRHAVTFTFEPYDEETKLYEQVSAYLQDPGTIAYGGRTNALVLLAARKSLGSSTFAVAQYLGTLAERLKQQQRATLEMAEGDLEDTLEDRIEAEENGDDEEEYVDPVKLAAEIVLVEAMRDLALSIGANAKGEKLIHNLPIVLDEIEAKGGQRKAVIFTESVRTQRYLNQLLSDNGYEGRIALLNGSNNDPESKEIYEQWRKRHAGTDRISGSKTADMKAAIVEAFKSPDKTILIATESGAEGINLQFCSLLINYDLPWNPQRVEQRIGRCHRYGQRVDVTVVNMLNLKNRAEARIHELLDQKLHLFEGVFGASDDVLGILTDGIDFEREVLRIVQSCRSADEAEREFDELTARISDSIDAEVAAARAKVLENMDADVVAKLHRREQRLAEIVPEYEQRLLMLAQAELPNASFPEAGAQDFEYDGRRWTTRWPQADENDWQFFRANDGLGAELIAAAKERRAEGIEEVVFDPVAYAYTGKLSGVADLSGQAGWLRAFKAIMPTQGAEREEILVVAETDDGQEINGKVGDRLMMAPAKALGPATQPAPLDRLESLQQQSFDEFAKRVRDENYEWLMQEEDRLSQYARDTEIEIEARISDLEIEIKELNKAKLSPHLSMEEKLNLRRTVSKKESERDELRMSQFEAKRKVQKEINERLDDMAALLDQQPRAEALFTLRFQVA